MRKVKPREKQLTHGEATLGKHVMPLWISIPEELLKSKCSGTALSFQLCLVAIMPLFSTCLHSILEDPGFPEEFFLSFLLFFLGALMTNKPINVITRWVWHILHLQFISSLWRAHLFLLLASKVHLLPLFLNLWSCQFFLLVMGCKELLP